VQGTPVAVRVCSVGEFYHSSALGYVARKEAQQAANASLSWLVWSEVVGLGSMQTVAAVSYKFDHFGLSCAPSSWLWLFSALYKGETVTSIVSSA